MIVNSHPYNPSQQAQQQRCISLGQPQPQNQNQMANNRLGQQQQNSLYGQQVAASAASRQSHMLDLANLQQSVFDSAYDDASGSFDQAGSRPANEPARAQLGTGEQQQATPSLRQSQQQNDMSLYSPSPSTSLLYHIYDQINLPSEHQPQYGSHELAKKANASGSTTTVLNPAHLFGGQPQPAQLHQISDFHKALQQQSIYSGASSQQYHHNLQQQQQPFGTLHHNHHLRLESQQHHNGYLTGQTHHHHHHHLEGQMMLDTIMRQHHAATTRHNQHRPLSSSGASSMSGHSMGLTYGRQARHSSSNSNNNNNSSTIKSQSNLSGVLQASQALSHLGIIGATGTGQLTPTSGLGANPKKLAHFTADKRCWARVQQRCRHWAYHYSAVFKCAILLILLAFCLMSIIKFTFLNQQQPALQTASGNYHNLQVSSLSSSPVSSPGNSNTNNHLLKCKYLFLYHIFKREGPLCSISHLDLISAPWLLSFGSFRP